MTDEMPKQETRKNPTPKRGLKTGSQFKSGLKTGLKGGFKSGLKAAWKMGERPAKGNGPLARKRFFETDPKAGNSAKAKPGQNLPEVIKVNQKHSKPFKKRRKPKDESAEIKDKKPKIPQELLDKYSRGDKVEVSGIKTKYFKEKQKRKEAYLDYATEQAARTELLLQESQGFIEPDEEQITAEYRQAEIAANVDLQSASKRFSLNLQFGPYRMRYTKNGRHLLLGGKRGHLAAFDWITKKLSCELNVMEEVADVAWLHVHTMFACAQKDYVYIYDNQGTELHCINRMHRVNRMEFLPYHFLLATGNSTGHLTWLDVSIGEVVANYNTKGGDIRLMCQNPANGVICTGGGKGVVSMWSPKVRKPLAKMLCHSTPMSAVSVDPQGRHLITAGLDRKLKIWDVRALSGPVVEHSLRLPASQVEMSQRGVLAYAQGTYLEMLTNAIAGKQTKTPYLREQCDSFIHSMHFCPYEDVLGLTTAKGFHSLLVPGSGEPNYDAMEDNPYETAKQRREHEVHALLEKIPAELITLNPNEIASVDAPTLQEKIDAKRAIFFLKPPQVNLRQRHKMKGKGGSAKAARNKQIVKDATRREFIADVREAKQQIIKEHREETENFIPLERKPEKPSVLDRFKPKLRKIQS